MRADGSDRAPPRVSGQRMNLEEPAAATVRSFAKRPTRAEGAGNRVCAMQHQMGVNCGDVKAGRGSVVLDAVAALADWGLGALTHIHARRVAQMGARASHAQVGADAVGGADHAGSA